MNKLEKLKALNEARTKGPWVKEGHKCVSTEDQIISVCDGSENTAFITALANEADWLIGCVEALQKIRRCGECPDCEKEAIAALEGK